MPCIQYPTQEQSRRVAYHKTILLFQITIQAMCDSDAYSSLAQQQLHMAQSGPSDSAKVVQQTCKLPTNPASCNGSLMQENGYA